MECAMKQAGEPNIWRRAAKAPGSEDAEVLLRLFTSKRAQGMNSNEGGQGKQPNFTGLNRTGAACLVCWKLPGLLPSMPCAPGTPQHVLCLAAQDTELL